MTTVEQTFLKPGRYRVGDSLANYTADDLREYAEGTNKALAAGVPVPLLLKHAPNGADDGYYEQFSTDGAKATDGVGWLKSVKINEDGSLSHVLDVTNEHAAKGIQDKSIRFTSPELRNNYIDGKGRKFGRVIRHVALTPTPRNPDQGEFETIDESAVQFSLDDYEGPIQMAEYDNPAEKDDHRPDSKTEPENPDMPSMGGDRMKSQAISACLSELGVELPSDVDFSGLGEPACSALLTGVKTLLKAKREAEMAKEKQNNGAENEVQEATGMQFSEDEIKSLSPVERKLYLGLKAEREENAKLKTRIEQFSEDHVTSRREQAVGELRRQLKSAKLPPGLRTKLEAKLDSVQFSESGEAASLTLSEAIDLFRESIPSHLQFDEGDADEAKPGEFITGDGNVDSLEAARAMNDEIDQELGYQAKREAVAAK